VTGLDKDLFASGPGEDLDTYIEHDRKPPLLSSAFDPEAFRAEIALAGSRGYSIDDCGSSPGVRCLAVAMVA